MAWSVVQSHPNASNIACAHLRRQGFTYYNPRYNERVKLKRGGISWRRTQLFSNYFFVCIADQWRAIKSTTGIANLLMAESEKPASIDDSFIDMLRSKEDPTTGLIILGKSKFNSGDVVQVKSGPFAFERGLFDCKRDDDRVYILLSMLGTQRRVEMLEDNLSLAG